MSCECGKCGPCVRERLKLRISNNSKAWKKANSEKVRNYIREYKRKYRLSDEIMMKDRARNTVNRAYRRGELDIELKCKCGSTSNIQFHHKDYNNPLDVEPMCADCHKALHIEMESWGG